MNNEIHDKYTPYSNYERLHKGEIKAPADCENSVSGHKIYRNHKITIGKRNGNSETVEGLFIQAKFPPLPEIPIVKSEKKVDPSKGFNGFKAAFTNRFSWIVSFIRGPFQEAARKMEDIKLPPSELKKRQIAKLANKARGAKEALANQIDYEYEKKSFEAMKKKYNTALEEAKKKDESAFALTDRQKTLKKIGAGFAYGKAAIISSFAAVLLLPVIPLLTLVALVDGVKHAITGKDLLGKDQAAEKNPDSFEDRLRSENKK